MQWKRMFFILCLTPIVLVFFGTIGHAAKKFPNKQVNWYLFSSPGGGSDIFSRTAAIRLRRILKVPIVVINMTGGSGARMFDFALRKPKDGYTIMTVTNSALGTIVRRRTRVKFGDLVPVARGCYDSQTFSVPTSGKFKTIDQLVAHAKANPGKQKWGVAHAGGIDHVTVHEFIKAAGIKVDIVPYKSGGQIVAAALGGHIHVGVLNPSEVAGQVEASKMKALLALGPERVKIKGFDATPTAKEKGWDLDFATWRGVVVLKGTPPEVVKALEKALLKSMKHKVYQDYLRNNGMAPASVLTAADWGDFLNKKHPVWQKAMAELGFVKKN